MEIALKRPRYGTPRMTVLVRREIGYINHKLKERLYNMIGLQIPRKRKKKRKGSLRIPMPAPTGNNQLEYGFYE